LSMSSVWQYSNDRKTQKVKFDECWRKPLKKMNGGETAATRKLNGGETATMNGGSCEIIVFIISQRICNNFQRKIYQTIAKLSAHVRER